ncbi:MULTISPECIES: organic hydroperoxide resistance protein [Capnocytophaga]|jgi:peroxiredoxin, ohr subfamily|uniref:General stress protein 17o n=2 Tax=Capnocytophaga TaxID=1016 RepID=A0A2A3N6R1_CAPSP|nr:MULTISPECIES: organic hydroperoxide resistance protein [Capnocytophaga]ATA71024.1 organic hydroperoxide resistance protein [Capnocytophaga sputigena]ATA79992.1 organic hydroperoxide resistance protein [Capnocytophaga sputigena]ATA84703.1 organic hydroperoxide resistance protein [Capnocytophaga sputigena]EEB65752.1 peroxiredoxin, Ohr subfamily [Capnocytophaga sputigena ATCC 33612]MBI1668219.1 organic hydroperoxide resistance protein [Capnocytophaga periodontitidis]
MTAMYTAVATATGAPNRKVTSDNGVLSLELRSPKALGGANDDYTNPEQLFAAGYAACFDTALNLVIKQAKVTTGVTTVTAHVSIGKLDTGGFIFAVTLQVNVPGVSLEQAKELADKAHQVCPYSNSTRGNIEVTTEVTNN